MVANVDVLDVDPKMPVPVSIPGGHHLLLLTVWRFHKRSCTMRPGPNLADDDMQDTWDKKEYQKEIEEE
jgi:hypothetical protein